MMECSAVPADFPTPIDPMGVDASPVAATSFGAEDCSGVGNQHLNGEMHETLCCSFTHRWFCLCDQRQRAGASLLRNVRPGTPDRTGGNGERISFCEARTRSNFFSMSTRPTAAASCGILRAAPPSFLARDGWSSKTLKPGDEVQMTVDPLRSGAPAVRGTLTRSNTRTATRSSSLTDMRGHR
jgi:hypothetical protein